MSMIWNRGDRLTGSLADTANEYKRKAGSTSTISCMASCQKEIQWAKRANIAGKTPRHNGRKYICKDIGIEQPGQVGGM